MVVLYYLAILLRPVNESRFASRLNQKKILSDTFTCPILGPVVPLFWISSDVSSLFQSQSGFCLIHIAEVNVMYIYRDSPLVLHLLTSWQTALQGIDWFQILPKDITGTSEAWNRNHRIMSSMHEPLGHASQLKLFFYLEHLVDIDLSQCHFILHICWCVLWFQDHAIPTYI